MRKTAFGYRPWIPEIRYRIMTRPHGIFASGIILCMALTGCVRKQAVTGSGGINAIVESEILASEAEDVLELIQTIRPAWLLHGSMRDPANPWESEGPVVLINDIPPKPVFSLQFMSLDNIREIRFLTRTFAETRYRVGAPDGLILILTHSGLERGDTVVPDTGRTFSMKESTKLMENPLLSAFSEARHD